MTEALLWPKPLICCVSPPLWACALFKDSAVKCQVPKVTFLLLHRAAPEPQPSLRHPNALWLELLIWLLSMPM